MPGATCGPPPGADTNGSIGIGGVVMGGTGGASVSAGIIVSSDNVCFYQQYCGLLGGGFAAGVGVDLGGSPGKLCSGKYTAKGGFAAGGDVVFGGGSVSASDSGISVASTHLGLGGGEAAGGMACVIKLSCSKPCDEPSCNK